MKENPLEIKLSAEEIIRFLRFKKSDFWVKEGEKRTLALFHEAARRVPAYRDFLKKNKISPEKIKTFVDFGHVPFTSKKDYLYKYPLSSVVWDGTLKNDLVWSATSGSTGEPYYFPRSQGLAWESSIIHEAFLRNCTRGSKGPTLVIVGFGMGVWIGGLITTEAFHKINQRGESASVIAPGVNKKEIFNALKNLAPQFSNTILTGYPPFIKDVVDEASDSGINLKNLNLRLLFAAESFNERFRDYLVKKTGIKNPCLDTMNIYGTADIGTMAYETPVGIMMRRLAIKNKKLFKLLFSSINKTPTLAQFNPLFINFEAVNGEILLTGDNDIPLIRYAIGDNGGVIRYDEAISKMNGLGYNIKKEAEKHGIANYVYELPFVYVYERSDFAVKLHLRDIYPEIIRDVVGSKPFSNYLTGKFTMTTKYNRRSNQYLEINLELKKDKTVNDKFKKQLKEKLLRVLYHRTTGPGNPSEFIKIPGLLKMLFWPAEHNLYFKPGVKQKWVIMV